MKLTFKDKEYTLKYGFRSLMLYENIAKESFQPTTITNIINFFYACLLAQSLDDPIKYDDFLDWLDDNPNQLTVFSDWLLNIITTNDKIANKEDKKDKKDKKKDKPIDPKN